ncbi:MAG: hypothetical protein PHF21_03950, partial [Bacilli bacterium]|nr:hypothetical protein [Bacilli bacterium]
MFKQRSKLLFITIFLESIFSVWTLFYFNYLDRLNYQESIIKTEADLALFIKNMFTSSWWALIILTLCLISIFGIIAFIYKDLKFQMVSILLWVVLFIISLDFKSGYFDLLSLFMI